MTNNNLDIFILTYKNFQQQVYNKCYNVVSCKNVDIDTSLNVIYDTEIENYKKGISDSITEWNDFYSELTMTYWLNKNYNLKDYVGICQYRRYFNFMDEIPNMDELFKTYDAILPQPFKFPISVSEQYAYYHNIKDLNLLKYIIKEYFNDYYSDTEKVLNDNIFFPCNMFIMKKEDFKKYCDFIFNVINKFNEKRGFNVINDVREFIYYNKEEYFKSYHPNNKLWYQLRIGGFFAERLLTIFVKHHFKNIKYVPIIVTENKYKM